MQAKERQKHLLNLILTGFMAILFTNLMLLLATKRMGDELEALYIQPLQDR